MDLLATLFQTVIIIYYKGYAFTKDFWHATYTMAHNRRGWRDISSTLQLYGRVCMIAKHNGIIFDTVNWFRLGEACSHIAAIISTLVAANSIRQRSTSVTSQRCSWLPPAKNVSTYTKT